MRYTDSWLDRIVRIVRVVGRRSASVFSTIWKHVEKTYLSDGWGPVRAVLALAEFVVFALGLVAYGVNPHHRGALRWLVIALASFGVWALLEMLRWRVKYRSISRTAATAIPVTAAIDPGLGAELARLYVRGKVLRGLIPTTDPKKPLGVTPGVPKSLSEKHGAWRGEVRATLQHDQDLLDLFDTQAKVDAMNMFIDGAGGSLYAQIRQDVQVLGELTGAS